MLLLKAAAGLMLQCYVDIRDLSLHDDPRGCIFLHNHRLIFELALHTCTYAAFHSIHLYHTAADISLLLLWDVLFVLIKAAVC